MKDLRLIVGICMLYILSLAGSLNLYEINGPEPKRAVVSIEMFLSGEMIVPTIHGEAYYNKPPLFNWVQVLFFKVFDSFSETICRLPGILSLLVTAALLFFLGKFLFDRLTGIFAFLIFLTFSHLYYYGSVRAGSVDIFLAMIFFLQVGSIIYFAEKKKFLLLFIASYFFAALGFLTKGLPSLLGQVISLLTVFIFYRNFREFFSLKHLIGIVVFLGTSGIYFYAYAQKGDAGILLVNLFTESAKRYHSGTGIWEMVKYTYLIPYRALVMVMLPWSLVLFTLMRKHTRRETGGSKPFMLVTWLLVTNIFLYLIAPDFSPRYIYPFLPLSALVFAKLLRTNRALLNHPRFINIFTIILIILTLSTISILFVPYFSNVEHLILKLLLLAAAFILLMYILNRTQMNVFYATLFILVFTRFFVNYIYLPSYQAHEFSFMDKSNELLELSSNEEICLTGTKDLFNVSLAFGNFEIEGSRKMIVVPPVIPDQITFYYNRSQKRIFRYVAQPERGTLCLARKNFQPPYDTEELLVFDDHFMGHELVLYRVKEKRRITRDSMAVLDPR